MRLIDADCLRDYMWHICGETDEEIDKGRAKWESGLWIRYKVFEEALDRQITVEAEPKWVPIKYRLMDDEEKQYWSEYMDADDEMEAFDCPMPEDGQGILVTSKSGYVNMDICEIDGGLYGLEENGDWDGIIAWMPLPEPYREVEE